MTRDYAKKNPASRNKNQRRNNQRPAVSGWIWFLAGAMLGTTVTLLVKLSDVEPGDSPVAKNSRENHDNNQTPEPRFDFYTLLRETEVLVPENEEPRVTTSNNSRQPDSVFLLQVGSFKNARDADSLRARLLLLNLEATIEEVSPRPGETWHRVLAGPFASNSELASARTKLASNRIDSLILKRKQ